MALPNYQCQVIPALSVHNKRKARSSNHADKSPDVVQPEDPEWQFEVL